MSALTLIEAGAMLLGTGRELDHAEHRWLEDACKTLKASAQHAIGTYEFQWPQLAAATQADRVRKGYSANDPLLRTGALKDSIEYVVRNHDAEVGTNNPVAKYQEFGTSGGGWGGPIPPRPFMGGALNAEKDHIEQHIARMVGEVFRKR